MITKEKQDLNYDEVLECIGQFGTFQRKIFFLLWLVSADSGLAVVVFAFTGKIGFNFTYSYTILNVEV